MVRWFHSLLRDTDTMRNELMGAPPIIHPLRGMNDDILHTDVLLSARPSGHGSSCSGAIGSIW